MGVSVTASCLSEKRVEMMSAQLPAALYIKIRIPTTKIIKSNRFTVKGELPREDSAESDGEVDDASIDYGCQNGCGQFSNDFSEEVGRDGVHVIIDFTQEDGSFIREYEYDILYGVECDGHGHEEESTVSILHALYGSIAVLEEDDGEDGGDDGDNEFDVGSLRETDCVEEVTFEEKTELVPPGDLAECDFLIADWRDVRADHGRVVFQCGSLVRLVEERDALVVLLQFLLVSLQPRVIFRILLYVLTLNAHYAHEMISRVRHLRAAVLFPQTREIVHCQLSLIEVDYAALCEKHQTIEQLVNV